MSEAIKPTPGEWRFYTEPQPNGCPIVGANGLMVCMLAHSVNYADQAEEAVANARLISEAGTVHHETGLTPRQLVEQRDALAAALAICESALAWAIEQGGGPACEHEASVCFCRENEAVNSAHAALALVKGATP